MPPNPHLTDHERQIAERCERATAGPWECVQVCWQLESADKGPRLYVGHDGERDADIEATEDDYAFVRNARTDIPHLLTALAAARRECEELRGRVRELENAQ